MKLVSRLFLMSVMVCAAAMSNAADRSPVTREASVTAEVTIAQGVVNSQHNGITTAVRRGAVLSAGSVLSCAANGRAVVYWRPGLIAYLSENSSIELSGSGVQPAVKVLRGAVRLVSNGRTQVRIHDQLLIQERGVARFDERASVARIVCERGSVGSAVVTASGIQLTGGTETSDGSSLQLGKGEAASIDSRDGFQLEEGDFAATPERNLEQLRMTTVAQVSREQRGKNAPPPPPLPMDAERGAKDEKKADGKLPAGSDDRGATGKPSPMPSDVPPTNDETTRAPGQLAPPEPDTLPEIPTPRTTAPASQSLGTSGINLALGSVSLSTAAGGAGGLFTDANQATTAGRLTAAIPGSVINSPAGIAMNSPFPGNIYPITSETRHTLVDADLLFSDNFPLFRQYWSIGTGASPTSQVTTGIFTGTGLSPDTLRIPHFDAYIVRLDQFGIPDPASDAAAGDQTSSVSGLVGATPLNPDIQGATPLTDTRAEINPNMTFALGELAVGRDGNHPQLIVRRSDQDRMIVKDSGGNPVNDQVTVNTQVQQFVETVDPLFFPSNSSVYVPGRGQDVLSNRPTFGNVDLLRKAAATTLMAHELRDYARRTGQTRFVVDGKILDITGYKGP